jgi:hypothetical protein
MRVTRRWLGTDRGSLVGRTVYGEEMSRRARGEVYAASQPNESSRIRTAEALWRRLPSSSHGVGRHRVSGRRAVAQDARPVLRAVSKAIRTGNLRCVIEGR